jgi:hypothetical protein
MRKVDLLDGLRLWTSGSSGGRLAELSRAQQNRLAVAGGRRFTRLRRGHGADEKTSDQKLPWFHEIGFFG